MTAAMTTGMTSALDGLAGLVAFPRGDLANGVRNCVEALSSWCPAGAEELGRFGTAIANASIGELQDEYTVTFDLNPACALELGWHVFGETFERGEFLASMRDDLTKRGVAEAHGLPDHLAHVLPLLAREDAPKAAALASLAARPIAIVKSALADRGSRYMHLLTAVEAVVATFGSGFPPEAPTS